MNDNTIGPIWAPFLNLYRCISPPRMPAQGTYCLGGHYEEVYTYKGAFWLVFLRINQRDEVKEFVPFSPVTWERSLRKHHRKAVRTSLALIQTPQHDTVLLPCHTRHGDGWCMPVRGRTGRLHGVRHWLRCRPLQCHVGQGRLHVTHRLG
jgi:hypothetical protein